jgi:hypothetical protein
VSLENKKPASSSEDDKTITEVGRELLKYLHRRAAEMGVNQASYRQARMELLRMLEGSGESAKFNWGFETVFTQEIHTLEDLGLISVKYGSGAIMAGKGKPNLIYNVALTDDGKDTARIIVDREERIRSETAKLDKHEQPPEVVDDDEEEQDETDRSNSDKSDDISTRAEPAPTPPNEEDVVKKPPQALPGDQYAKD